MTMMMSNYFFMGRGAIAILGPVTTNVKEIVVAAKAQFLRIHGDFSGLDRLQQMEETSGVIAWCANSVDEASLVGDEQKIWHDGRAPFFKSLTANYLAFIFLDKLILLFIILIIDVCISLFLVYVCMKANAGMSRRDIQKDAPRGKQQQSHTITTAAGRERRSGCLRK
jgi:hypothetical protein